MQTNTQQLSAQQVNNSQQGWFNLATFWQLNLAVGLSMMTLFVFAPVSSHALMYQIQHAFSNLADLVGLDTYFFEAMMCLSFVGVFFAIRYSKLAQTLKINRLILSMILVGNIGLLWTSVAHYSPRAIRELSTNDVGGFLFYVAGNLMRIGFWLAFIGLIATLLWHYVVKPRPTLKNLVVKLLQAHPSNVQTTQATKVSRGIAIIILVMLGFIGWQMAQKALSKTMHQLNATGSTSSAPQKITPQFNIATWRDAIELTQPALDAEKNNNWALAVNEWSTLRSAYPQDFDVLQHRADAYVKLGIYKIARLDAYEMITLSKNNPQGWQTLCLFKLVDKQTATGACQQATQLNPWSESNALHLADALLFEGKTKNAAVWYQKAISLIATQEELQTLLDDFERLKKQGINDAAFSAAQANFAQQGKAWLEKLAPANQLLQAAEAAEEKGDFEKAVQLYQQHIDALNNIAGETNGQTILATQQLAALLAALNRTDEALHYFEDIQKTVENDLGKDHPNMVNILNNHAYVLTNANKNDKAKKIYAESLALSEYLYGVNSPQSATALNGLGSTNRKMGHTNLADTALTQSTEISLGQLLPDYQLLGKRMNNLGLFYYDVGSLSTAELYFRNALEMTEHAVGKNHPDVFWRVHNLFKVRMAKQDIEGAKTWLSRVQQVAHMHPKATHAYMKKVAEEDAQIYQAQVK